MSIWPRWKHKGGSAQLRDPQINTIVGHPEPITQIFREQAKRDAFTELKARLARTAYVRKGPRRVFRDTETDDLWLMVTEEMRNEDRTDGVGAKFGSTCAIQE